jgi:hypothetical protein
MTLIGDDAYAAIANREDRSLPKTSDRNAHASRGL